MQINKTKLEVGWKIHRRWEGNLTPFYSSLNEAFFYKINPGEAQTIKLGYFSISSELNWQW